MYRFHCRVLSITSDVSAWCQEPDLTMTGRFYGRYIGVPVSPEVSRVLPVTFDSRLIHSRLKNEITKKTAPMRAGRYRSAPTERGFEKALQ